MDVVGPLGVQAETTGLPRGHRVRVVPVRLRDQPQRSSESGRGCADLGRELLEQGDRPVVVQRVNGVQTQPVDVEVAQPHQGVLDDEAADRVAVGVVQVERLTPRGAVAIGEVRPEVAEPVAARSEVVVDDVEHDAEASGVAGVDEPGQAVRSAVGLVHGPESDAVVAPAVAAGEGRDRHQLDDVDPQLGEVVEVVDRGVEGPLGRERADVQLVDHRTGQRDAAPGLVGPARWRRARRPRPSPTGRRAAGAHEDRPAPRHRRGRRRSASPAALRARSPSARARSASSGRACAPRRTRPRGRPSTVPVVPRR